MWIIHRILDIRHVVIGLAAAGAAVWIVQPYELRLPERFPLFLAPYEESIRDVDWMVRRQFRPRRQTPPSHALDRSEHSYVAAEVPPRSDQPAEIRAEQRPQTPASATPLLKKMNEGQRVKPDFSRPKIFEDDDEEGPRPSQAKEKPTPSTLEALQHTPTGRVELGERLFSRMSRVKSTIEAIKPAIDKEFNKRGIKSTNDQAVLFSVDFELAKAWGDTTYARRFPEREFGPAWRRFDELVKVAKRTPQQEQELWNLIVVCGRDWLRIPFDEKSQRFDLSAKLEASAPEMWVEKHKELYQTLSGKPWGS
jgi:hypothetical protein